MLRDEVGAESVGQRDGKLKAIEAEWLQTATGAPLIK